MKEKEFNLSEKRKELRKDMKACNCSIDGIMDLVEQQDKEFIRQVENDFELWKLKEFGINVCVSPKFNKFIEKLRKRAGKDLI